MEDVVARTTLERQFRLVAWAGSRSDLTRLLELAQRIIDPVAQKHIAEELAPLRNDVARWEKQAAEARAEKEQAIRDEAPSYVVETIESSIEQRERYASDDSERLKRTESRVIEDTKFRMVSTDTSGARRTTIGDASDIADELSALRVREFTLDAPTQLPGYSLHVWFERGNDLRLQVRSSSIDWAESAFSQLKDELMRKRPWWWWMRTHRFFLPFSVALNLATLFFLYVNVWPAITDENLGKLLLSFAYSVPAAGVGIAAERILNLVLPGFEIVESGSRARGTTALAFAGASLAWVAAIVIGFFV